MVWQKGSAKTLIVKMFLLFFVMLTLFVVYIHIWEYNQPKKVLKNVTIFKIVKYYYSGGDLHWGYRGFRVYIANDHRPIDFPIRNWNNSIKINTRATLIVRESFFGEELDGLSIESADPSK